MWDIYKKDKYKRIPIARFCSFEAVTFQASLLKAQGIETEIIECPHYEKYVHDAIDDLMSIIEEEIEEPISKEEIIILTSFAIHSSISGLEKENLLKQLTAWRTQAR